MAVPQSRTGLIAQLLFDGGQENSADPGLGGTLVGSPSLDAFRSLRSDVDGYPGWTHGGDRRIDTTGGGGVNR